MSCSDISLTIVLGPMLARTTLTLGYGRSSWCHTQGDTRGQDSTPTAAAAAVAAASTPTPTPPMRATTTTKLHTNRRATCFASVRAQLPSSQHAQRIRGRPWHQESAAHPLERQDGKPPVQKTETNLTKMGTPRSTNTRRRQQSLAKAGSTGAFKNHFEPPTRCVPSAHQQHPRPQTKGEKNTQDSPR